MNAIGVAGRAKKPPQGMAGGVFARDFPRRWLPTRATEAVIAVPRIFQQKKEMTMEHIFRAWVYAAAAVNAATVAFVVVWGAAEAVRCWMNGGKR